MGAVGSGAAAATHGGGEGSEASGLVEPAEWVGGYVKLLVDARSRLRAQKRWEEADRIRAGLERLGVTLQDSPSATTWILEERK